MSFISMSPSWTNFIKLPKGSMAHKCSNFLMQNAVIINAVSWNCVLPKIHALKLCWYLKEGPLEITGHEGGTLWEGLVFQQKTSECSSVTCHWQKEGGFCKLKEVAHCTPHPPAPGYCTSQCAHYCGINVCWWNHPVSWLEQPELIRPKNLRTQVTLCPQIIYASYSPNPG